MAYTITSESYGARLPKITATADSTDDLATLGTSFAEGSTCVIGDTTYKLDEVQGWVDPSSGGGSSSLPFDVFVIGTTKVSNQHILTKTAEEIIEAANSGALVLMHFSDWEVGDGVVGSPWGVLKQAYDSGEGISHYSFQFSNYDYSFLCSEASDYPAEDMG